MKLSWGKVWTAIKIGLFILNKAQEKDLVRIKELPKINDGIGVITDAIKEAQKNQPPPAL